MMITGTAGDTRYVALPPDNPDTDRTVLVWHLLGEPGTPEDMATALPLHGLDAWRIYPALPATGPHPGQDPVTDWYTPMVDTATTAVPALLAHTRHTLGTPTGPVDLVGGSAGGHVALLTATRHTVPVRRIAVINPAITAHSVVAASTALGLLTDYPWPPAARTAADHVDITTRTDRLHAPLLIVRGEHEYPEFRPVQDALRTAVPGARLVEVPGLAHMLDTRLDTIDTEVTAWLA